MQNLAGCQIFLCAISLLLGALCVQTLGTLPAIPAVLTVAALAGGGLYSPTLRPISFFILGFCWTVFRADLILTPSLPSELQRQNVELQGHVSSLVQDHGSTLKFTFTLSSLTHDKIHYPHPGRVLLRWHDADRVPRFGEGWKFRARLKQPHGFQNPGGFDYEKWLFRHGIRAVGYVRQGSRDSDYDRFSSWAEFRETVGHVLDHSGLEKSGLLRALVIGDRSGVSQGERDVLIRTGTMHLLAISGLHVGMVAGFSFFIGSFIARIFGVGLLWVRASTVGVLCAVSTGAIYALLAGFTIPTQRALIMICAVMLALLANRSTTLARSLAMALILVLIADPLSVLDTGLWLSFGALVAIVVVLRSKRDAAGYLQQLIRLQFLITFLMAPLILLFFGQVSLVAPLANLFAIPVIGMAVVPLALSATVVLTTGWLTLAEALYAMANLVLQGLWYPLSVLSAPHWAIWVISPPVWTLLLAGAGLILLTLYRHTRPGLVGALCLLPLLGSLLCRPVNGLQHGEFALTLLDVGQGLAVVVRTKNRVLLYDTGARFSENFNAGSAVVVPYFRATGIARLDLLVISHGDTDHIGGMDAVLRSLPAADRLTSVPDKVPDSHPCTAGQRWTWDGVEFSMLHPDSAFVQPHNNASCVIRIISPAGSALLTGDIELETERLLERSYGDNLRSNILLVPHQGSKTSSSASFLNRVAPDYAVVSAGYLNRYGHPARTVTERYQRRGIPTFNTAEEGAVAVDVRLSGIRVSSYRKDYRRYWFDQTP